MKKFDCVIASTKCVAISLMLCAFLAACGGDASSSASSVTQNGESNEGSGDTSLCEDTSEGCGEIISGNSNEKSNGSSDSKGKTNSSSSSTKSKSSYTGKQDCSALLAENEGWSWDVPKECRFNPNIDYDSIIDSRDGHVYKTVKIGVQEWMAENLNYYDATLDGRSWCYGAENSENTPNCAVTGRLYTWTAAINMPEEECGSGKSCNLRARKIQGLCPDGWLLPSIAEWDALLANIGEVSVYLHGDQLRSQTGWCRGGACVGGGRDLYGFSALPAGLWAIGSCHGACSVDQFIHDGSFAYFWSSNENLDSTAHSEFLGGNHGLNHSSSYKNSGLSVRCLKGDASSSTLVELASPCKTESEDSCEYGELEDSRDGQTYKTVTIGTQTWMAENLNFKTDSSSCYDNEESNCTKYGRLYTWAAAIGKSENECGYGYVCSLPSGNIQGACPSGWHLPSDDEWYTLINAVGGSSTAEKVLRSTSGWKDDSNGTDAFGFSALPAGYRYIYNGEIFSGVSIIANFWSSTEYTRNIAYIMEMGFEKRGGFKGKNEEVSIRCVKD